MNNYMVITLKNNIKYIVIDVLKQDDKKYFLVSKLEDEIISNIYTICEYDENNNCFKEIVDMNDIEELFLNRINSKKRVLSYYEEIKQEMIKLHIIDINSNLYLLRDDDGNLYKKDIIFINDKPKINEHIYLTDPILKEDNIFTYGNIYNSNSINKDEIIILEENNNSIILQRYYG